jgi:hypothetical protein
VRAGLLIVPVLAALGLTVTAAVPTLDSVYPPGGKKGSEIAFTLNGKFDPWPCNLWFSGKGLTFIPDPDPKKPGTGKLTIASDAAPGPVFIRAHNAEGATLPVLFIIGEQTEILEEEKDNSTVSGALPLDRTQLPLVINGTLSAGGELDSKRIALEKGETLFAAVEAYALRSLVDPAIHLHDAAGNRLLLEHDGPDNLDPLLTFTAPEKGDYILSLAGFSHPPAASVAYTGSKSANYRLHLALKREQLPKHLGPADPGPDTAADILAPGKPLVGTLKTAAAPNRYKITAKKGDKLLLKVEGRALGYPVDPVLRLLKVDGSEIRKEDDTGKSSDPEYLWTVAEDGEYAITVGDRFSRGGETMRYRLSATAPVADFTVTLDKNLYALERGKPLEIKATVTRLHGHKDNLAFTIPGLPAGMTLTAPETIPEKGGEVILKLESKADAPAASLSLRVIATEKKAEGDTAKPIQKTAVFSFKDDNYRGPYVLDEIADIWITLPPVKEEKKEEKKEEEKPK